MTEKDKIKQLLLSPDESNQRVGVQLAKSILDWDYHDIVNFVITQNLDDEDWTFINQDFCGVRIYYTISKGSYECSLNMMDEKYVHIKRRNYTESVHQKYLNKLRKLVVKELKKQI